MADFFWPNHVKWLNAPPPHLIHHWSFDIWWNYIRVELPQVFNRWRIKGKRSEWIVPWLIELRQRIDRWDLWGGGNWGQLLSRLSSTWERTCLSSVTCGFEAEVVQYRSCMVVVGKDDQDFNVVARNDRDFKTLISGIYTCCALFIKSSYIVYCI